MKPITLPEALSLATVDARAMLAAGWTKDLAREALAQRFDTDEIARVLRDALARSAVDEAARELELLREIEGGGGAR